MTAIGTVKRDMIFQYEAHAVATAEHRSCVGIYVHALQRSIEACIQATEQ